MTTKCYSDDLFNALHGEWQIVYSEIDGQMTDVSDFSKIVLKKKGNHFVVEKSGDVVAEGKFSIDTTVTPHQLVYIYSKGADVFMGAPRQGIFQLEGNTLKACQGAIGHHAPRDFHTFPGSEAVLTIYQKRGAEHGVANLNASKTRLISQW